MPGAVQSIRRFGHDRGVPGSDVGDESSDETGDGAISRSVEEEVGRLWADAAAATGTARAHVLLALGHVLFDLDRHQEALAAVGAARDVFADADQPEDVALCDHNRAVVLYGSGRLAESLERHRAAADGYARVPGFEAAAAGCLAHVAELQRELGDVDGALVAFADAVDRLEHLDERREAGRYAVPWAATLLEAGRPDEAVSVTDRARVLLTGDVAAVAACEVVAADAFLRTGAVGAALEAVERAESLWDAVGDDDELDRCAVRRAEALVAGGDVAAARAAVAPVRTRARARGDAVLVARCDLVAARVDARSGRPDEARRRFVAAATVFEAAGRTVEADGARREAAGVPGHG